MRNKYIKAIEFLKKKGETRESAPDCLEIDSDESVDELEIEIALDVVFGKKDDQETFVSAINLVDSFVKFGDVPQTEKELLDFLSHLKKSEPETYFEFEKELDEKWRV